jgi:4-diphosphocytidyl-2-C-methyl-D-erythritol kinase
LVAANIVWNLRLSVSELSRVAAEIGSDVPFFLGPPAAICRGRGEIIEPLPPMPILHVVVARPPVGLSTPAVYKECRPSEIPLSSSSLVEAWQCGDWARLGSSMANRLEPAAEKISPWIERLRNAFAAQGCWGYQMSGSGSSYFGICRSARQAQAVANRLRVGGLGFVANARTIGMSNAGEVHAA